MFLNMIMLFPFLGISVKYGTINTNNTWRHEKCSFILHNPNINGVIGVIEFVQHFVEKT